MAANLTAPIFNGGKLKQEVKRSLAARDENLYKYASTLYSAINEVQDAASRETHQKEKIRLLLKRIESSKMALIHSQHEYRSGDSDYISVIERYNALKKLEVSLVTEKTKLIEYRVSLYRSIGNKWTNDFVKDLGKKNEK